MAKLTTNLRDHLPTDVFTDTEVRSLLQGSDDRRYGLVKRALADGDLIQLRRGVYSFGKRYQRQKPNLYELAQKIYPLSYVSLESALSFHGWIPEATYTVTSISLRRSQSFETPLGLFSFNHLPRFNFIGVERFKEGTSIFLMATPAKALLDYVFAHKVTGLSPRALFEGLRIEREAWTELPIGLVNEIAVTYRSKRVSAFAKKLERDLKL